MAATSVIAGTFGYVDPDHLRCGQYLPRHDLYSFGVVLLQLLLAQKAFDPTPQFSEYPSLVDRHLDWLEDPMARTSSSNLDGTAQWSE